MDTNPLVNASLRLLNFAEAIQKAGFGDVEIAADSETLHGYLSTGNLALNYIISGKLDGGWPLGHVSEIYGDPSTGKSYLVARAIAEALSLGGVAVLDDTENAFNSVWASSALGVDISRLVRASTRTVEEHCDLIEAMVKAIKANNITTPSVLALDSLPLLSTKEEVEGGMEKLNMKRAQVIKKAMRLMAAPLNEVHTAYLIANHTIDNIGDIYNPKTTPGGGGVKFQATVRLQLSVASKMKDASGKNYIGVKVRAQVTKNRLVPPYKKTEMLIPFYSPITPTSGLIPLLFDLGVISGDRKIEYKGAKTDIPVNKSDFWKQDESAMQLLEVCPEIIQDVADLKNVGTTSNAPMVAEDDNADK